MASESESCTPVELKDALISILQYFQSQKQINEPTYQSLVSRYTLADIILLLQSVGIEEICKNNLESFDFSHFVKFCEEITECKPADFASFLFDYVWPYNQGFQFAFIRYVLNDGSEILSNCPKLDMSHLEIRIINQAWLHPCAYRILIGLSSAQVASVQEVFDTSAELIRNPSLLFTGLLECKQTESKFLHQLFGQTVSRKLKTYLHPPKGAYNNAIKVFSRIWQDENNRDSSLDWARKVWIDTLINCYIEVVGDAQSEAEQKQKILEMCQDLKVFAALQKTENVAFLIDFACFASRRDYLNLETFLKENWMKCCSTNEDDEKSELCSTFIEASLDFVHKRIDLINQDPNMNESFMKPLKIMVNFFASNLQKLNRKPNHLERQCADLIHKIATECVKYRISPEAVPNQSENAKIFKPSTTADVSKHLEILKIKKIEEYIGFIKKKITFDLDYFECLLSYLNEWCQQIDSKPQSEYRLIGELIGEILKNKLVHGQHFAYFVWFTTLCLNNPKSKTFKIGVIILERFQSSLDQYPSIVASLAKYQLPPYLLLALNPKMTGFTPNVNLEGVFNSVFNNIDCNNIPILLKRIQPYFEDFNNHLYVCEKVLDRAISQANHQSIFMTLLLQSKSARLLELLLCMTYKKIGKSLEEKVGNWKIMKTLGSWLGLMTLGRNIPVLEEDLAVEELLYDAWGKGLPRTKKVVWLVSGLLTASAVVKSIVFRPKCPWTMNKLVILAFIHRNIENDLDVIRFEIENLVKAYHQTLQNLLKYTNHEKISDRFEKIKLESNSQTQLVQLEEDNQKPIAQAIATHIQTDSNNNAAELPAQDIPADSTSDSKIFTQSAAGSMVAPNYDDIDISDLEAFCHRFILIDSTMPLFQPFPKLINELRAVFRQVMNKLIVQHEKSIVNIVLNTTSTLIKNDFHQSLISRAKAADLHRAARSHVATFASSYTLVIIGEKLRHDLIDSLKQKCLEYLDNRVTVRLLESTMEKVVNDNCASCIGFIQKTFTEKAVAEISKLFPANEVQQDPVSRRSMEPRMMAFYENMSSNPFGSHEQPKTRSITRSQRTSMASLTSAASTDSESGFSSNESSANLDQLLITYSRLMDQTAEHIHELQTFNLNPEILLKLFNNFKKAKEAPADNERVEYLVNNIMDGLRKLLQKSNLFNMNGPEANALDRVRIFFTQVLRVLCKQNFKNNLVQGLISRHFVKHWTLAAIDFPDPLFDSFIRFDFVDCESLDIFIARVLQTGDVSADAVIRMLSFLKCYIKNGLNYFNFRHSMAALKRIMISLEPNHHLYLQLKIFFQTFPYREVMANTVAAYQQVFLQWTRIEKTEANKHKIYTWILKEVDKHEEALYEFLSVCWNCCLQRSYVLLVSEAKVAQSSSPLQFHEVLDCFTTVVMLLVQYRTSDYRSKCMFIERVTQLLVKSAQNDDYLKLYQGLPYHRVILQLFSQVFYFNSQFIYNDTHFRLQEINEISARMVFVFVEPLFKTLIQLSPAKIPEFVYPWLDLVSHRNLIGSFMSPKLNVPHFRLWYLYFMLLRDLFDYFRQQTKQEVNFVELSKALTELFLILWNDFSEFLCEFCNFLVCLIPSDYFQIRNCVLAACPAPANALPSFHLSFGSLNGFILPYKGMFEVSKFMCIPFNEHLTKYIHNGTPMNFPEQIHLYFSQSKDDSTKKDIIVNAVITLISQNVVDKYTQVCIEAFERNPSMAVIQSILGALDPKGQYNCLNHMANHLRYPNICTIYFSWAFLHLFKVSNSGIKERIFRVTLERLSGPKPYPWGLCFTMSQLCGNPVYQLWKCPFMQLRAVTSILRSLEIPVVTDGE